MADLFLSYATPDRADAERVREAQRARGVSCWMAPDDVGTGEYGAAINRAVSAAKTFVVIVSPAAATSEHVLREIALAADRRKRILPLVFTEYRADGALEYFVSGHQLIDCSNGRFEQGMDMVAAETRGAPRPQPRPVPPRNRSRELLAFLSAVSALLAAVTPFPIAAVARIALVAALLIFPVARAFAWTRSWPLARRCAASLAVLILCAWVLDRAALCTVIRRQLSPAAKPTSLVLYAPYDDVQDLHQTLPPFIDCTPVGSMFNWEGPQRTVSVARFVHPDTLRIDCSDAIDRPSLSTTARSRFELWDYDLYRWIRWLFIVIGGLAWAGFCLSSWRRRLR